MWLQINSSVGLEQLVFFQNKLQSYIHVEYDNAIGTPKMQKELACNFCVLPN